MKLINLEGIDGSGKTSFGEYLKTYIQQDLGKTVELLREPGGTEVSEKIRKILKNKKELKNDVTVALLFMAARSELIEYIKNLNVDYIILDRFSPSTFAYQVKNSNFLDWIKIVDKVARQDIEPDIVLYFYCETEKCIERIKKRDGKCDGFLNEENAVIIQSRYKLAKSVLNWNWRGVYSGGSIEETTKNAMSILEEEGIL